MELLRQIWEVVKQALISGVMPLVNSLVVSIIGLLVAWIFVRMINISKRNSKFNFVWMLVVSYINKAMTGPDKKAEVIKKAHAMFRNGFFNRFFGKVDDAMLDTWIEGLYNSVVKGIAPLPNVQTPSQLSLK